MSGTLAASTPTNRRLAGITAFSVNGSAIPVIEFTWDPAVTENETMSSLSGVDGYAQKPVAPFISGKFRDSAAVSVTGFTTLTNATVVVLLATASKSSGTISGTSADRACPAPKPGSTFGSRALPEPSRKSEARHERLDPGP